MLFVEVWCQFVIYPLLVAVEPIEFIAVEHLDDNGRGEDRYEGECVKSVIGAKSASLLVFNYEHGVFVSNSVTAFDVDTRFVGYGHAGE